MPYKSLTLSVTLNRPAKAVYDFIAPPENFPLWASGLCTSIRQIEGVWIAEAPHGQTHVRFTEPNDFGILDHYVTLPSGTEIQIPMRVVANDTGSELIFTLFQYPEMSDEKFADDVRWVRSDLKRLKDLLDSDVLERHENRHLER